MKVAVFGTGYVVLVTGACLADVGCEVICVDIDADKVQQLNKGIVPIYENGLETIVHNNQKSERLSFTVDAEQAIAKSDILFIAVGTPSDSSGACDLSHIISVAKTIGQNIQSEKIIINKSTVLVGTAQIVELFLLVN